MMAAWCTAKGTRNVRSHARFGGERIAHADPFANLPTGRRYRRNCVRSRPLFVSMDAWLCTRLCKFGESPDMESTLLTISTDNRGRDKMKMRNRILSIVGVALIGILLISGFALQALRQNMLESRQDEILKSSKLAEGVMERYYALEQGGKLTREQAQAQAVEALSGMRHGDDYIFVRNMAGMMLVHADPRRVGTLDKGSQLPDGRMTSDIYTNDLPKLGTVFMTAAVARPDDPARKPVPKLLGAVLFKPWNWVIGNGVFIDDIDTVFWSYAERFLLLGGALIVVLGALGGLLTRSILRQLGGEPQHAAEVVNVISSGDLSREIHAGGRPDSLLAAMQHMQRGLRDIIARVRQGSEAIGTASAEVANGNADLSNRTEQAAASLEQTSASMMQLSDTVRQSAEAARQASQFA